MTETCLKILLVEDEPAHAEAIRRAFAASRERAELHVAQTLGQYRDHVRKSPPDFAILDLNLPDGRAFDVLTSPAEAGRFPVLIMTSFGDEQVAVEAMKAGALDYIIKSPEAFTTMPRIVERCLREWKLLCARRQDEERIVHLNSVLRGARAINQLITRGEERLPLLQQACERVVETMGYNTAWIALRSDADELVLGAHAGLSPELASRLSARLERGVHPPCAGEAMEQQGVVVRGLPWDECCDCPLDGAYPHCGVLCARMEHRDVVYGVMVVAVPKAFAFDEEEQKLFQELVGDLSFAQYRLELEEQHVIDVSALHQAIEAQRRSAERWQSTFDAISDIVCVVSNEHRFLEMNQAGCRALSRTREQIIGRRCSELVHGADAAIIARPLEVVGQSMSPAAARHEHDGKTYELLAWPISGDEGRSAGYIHIVKDITAEVEAAREKEQLEQQLEVAQRLEAVGRLAGGVAHDFNNLLSVILSYAGFAAEALHESDPARADVLQVQGAAQRAAALTRQLLAFSRKQILEPVCLNVNKVISDVEKMLRRLLGEDIDIEVHLAEGIGSVLADPGQVEQVIMNLAVNARDAMPRGGKLTIETASVELDEDYAEQHVAVKPGRFVMLSVADNGIGMDAATKEHAFDPFFTTKEKGKGTGLGLSTVYGIVKQSGGNIWIYSEPGRGTTFKVYLPSVDAPAVEVRRSPTSAMARGSETVLVVEDEDAVRRLAERLLRSAGYQVHAASSGGDALVLCEKLGGAVDLLLTDVVMPQMSGRELAERLGRTCPRLRVLFMSGYTDNAIVHHGVLDPGTRFIGKPFAAAELARKVRQVLDEGRESLER